MAVKKKTSFPTVPEKNWWGLRKRFVSSIPTSVSEGYVSSVLGGMLPESARDNVIKPLKAIGLVGEDGTPTELARSWRDDSQYASVCEEIRKNIYPQELLDSFPDAGADPNNVRNWFANHTGQGEIYTRRMAGFYLLLLRADPSEASNSTPPKASKVSTTPKKQTPTKTRPAVSVAQLNPEQAPIQLNAQSGDLGKLAEQSTNKGMSLHIDIQIHISPEAKPEQIDKIFESMAKHLPLSS